MAVREMLLVTDAYAAFKQNVPEAMEIIRHAPPIGMNSIILGKLRGGFAVGTRKAANRQELERFLDSDRVRLFAVDETTAEYYAIVYRTLRRKGRPIPTNDMWIAATALQHGLAVFSYDNHFHVVDGLIVGDHLSDFVL